jgi:hypothetical protein
MFEEDNMDKKFKDICKTFQCWIKTRIKEWNMLECDKKY